MSIEDHHRAALMETARSELDRAHRAAISLEAGEVRRGLTLAAAALREAEAAEPAATVERALADLDSGSLAEMATLIEATRKTLEQ